MNRLKKDIKMICGKPVDEDVESSDLEKELKKSIVTGFLSLGLNIKEENVDNLVAYLKMIQHYQKKINLTSISDTFEIVDKHFLDSVSCIDSIKGIITEFAKEKIRMIDVGSGAGLPGIPVKNIFPEGRMTLLEARKNKMVFLDKVVKTLSLRNTTVIKDRSENLGKNPKHRECYHVVLSRAVAPLGVLCEYCLPLCRIQGAMIAFKGSSYQEELNMNYKVIEKLGGKLENINLVKIPYSDYMRYILFIRKIAPTPEKYPRRNGIPLKRPLCF